MPPLSTGTLNLKFMQRALGRSTPTTPSAPSTPSAPAGATPSAAAAAGKNTPVARPYQGPAGSGSASTPGPSVSTPAVETPTSKQLQEEEAAKWVLRPAGEASGSGSDSRRNARGTAGSGGAVVFDSSYVGFLGLDESQNRGSGSGSGLESVGGKQSGGGGRMTFGGFGDVPVSAREAEEQMDDDDDDGNHGGFADRSEVYEDTRRRRKIGAVIRKDGDDVKNVLIPQSYLDRSALAQRKFLRPGGSPSATDSSDEAGPSRPSPPKTGTKRKDTDTSLHSPEVPRKPLSTTTPAPTGETDRPAKKKKKSKIPPSSSTADSPARPLIKSDLPKSSTPNKDSSALRGKSIDERAKELKRQKKLKKRLST